MTTNRISISFAQSVQSVTSVIEHFSEVCLRRMLLSFSSLLNNSRFQRLCVSVVSLRPRRLCARTFSAQCFVSFVCFCSNPFPFPVHGNDLHQANKDNEEFWGRTAVGRCCGAAKRCISLSLPGCCWRASRFSRRLDFSLSSTVLWRRGPGRGGPFKEPLSLSLSPLARGEGMESSAAVGLFPKIEMRPCFWWRSTAALPKGCRP